ncbi:MAG TPA: TetR/AcrR family transcriptional regulator [Rhizomicrobium sp.]|nr:TetR/AcrR family transcriptional regulator [Rhizomicrobium sp.]
MAAAEAIILERGVDGFTLREAARRAGVSPAAPAHHFKDARGLLSEVALRGFQDFGDTLEAADRRGGNDPARRLHEQGLAYVNFAMKNPSRFQLMFRQGKFDQDYENFQQVANRSFLTLEGAVRAAYGLPPGAAMTEAANGFLMATWSIVHGFAHLALGGQLDWAAQQRGGKKLILDRFLPLTLRHLPAPVRK